MRNDLPISPKKKFKYSISFESFDEESLEAGQSDVRGFEIQNDTDAIGDILMLANTTYGIYMPVSFGTWESTEPIENTDFWERGIRKYYALHLTNEDGTEISQEENDFISFLLSDGRYEIDKFSNYAVGGIVIGSVVLGIGALITYFYFKGKKGGKGKKQLVRKTAKSVTYRINGKDRKFPINDAWEKEHSLENLSEDYEVPQEDRFEMGGDASEHYHEIEYGQGGVARAKEVITNKIGFNENIADYLVGKSEKFAIWLADSILKDEIAERGAKKTDILQYLNETSNSVNTNYISNNYGGAIREILDWLQHPITPKQELKQLSFEQALEKAREWHNELQVLGGDIDFIEPEKNTILKTYPKNSEGIEYYWVFIPSNYCDLESSRMGHCGRTGLGNNLISLRSVKPLTKGHTINDSHITIAYGLDDGKFYQVKGKKNNKPAEKYFPFIYDLIKSILNDDINQRFKDEKDESLKVIQNLLNEQKKIQQEILQHITFNFGGASSTESKFLEGKLSLDESTKYLRQDSPIYDNFRTIYKLKEKLNEVRNNRDYKEIENEIEILKDEAKNFIQKNIFDKFKEIVRLGNLQKEAEKNVILFNFNGFGKEYGEEEDFGFEDMTNEQLRELYDLKPSIFNDAESIFNLFENKIITEDELKSIIQSNPTIFQSFLNQYKLFELGIISEKPSTTFEINYDCEDVSKLLVDEANFSIESVLCSEDDYYEMQDGFDYYFTNPTELVDNLNEKNTQLVIDEIVKITGLEKSVVEENGINYYLLGEDENFEIDYFDDISRALANAQNIADNIDYSKYFYDSLEDSLSELGEVHSLNYEGIKMTIDLSNIMSDEVIAEQMDYYDFTDVIDLFEEEIANRNIDLPKLRIDDRYSAYGSSEDFNDNFDINNYAKGGSLRPKNINKNKIKNMKPSQTKLAHGGSIKSTGISKEDYFLVVQNWVYFTFNYPMGFVKDAFGSSRLTNHLQEKFSSAYTRYGSVGVLMSFWANLDNEHREMLSVWIKNNYFNSSSKQTQLQSISDEDYAKIITHWNMFCFNFPYNFIESVFGDNTSHYEEKWVRAYESAGSTGAVNKFFTELSGDNQHIFTDWVYENYDGMKYAKGGSVDKKGKIELSDGEGGRKIAKRIIVETDDAGDVVTYELEVGLFASRKKGYFIVQGTWDEVMEEGTEDEYTEEQYFAQEGGLWIESGRVYDYDGVYELSEKLRPLMSALNLNSSEIFADGGEAKVNNKNEKTMKYANGGGLGNKTLTRKYLQNKGRNVFTFGYGMPKDAIDKYGTIGGTEYFELSNGDVYKKSKEDSDKFVLIGNKSKYAMGGKINSKKVKKKTSKNKNPKIVRYYFDDAPQTYAKGGMFGESAKLEYIGDAYASDEMANELREKLGIETDSLGDNYVISFAYTDYGGDFLDKVAIAYFSETYPENTIKENSGWGGENAFVFGEPAKEWIEQTQDYPLGFEDFEDFYMQKENEQEAEDFNYFLDDLNSDYTFDREAVIDWLMENRSGYYGMTTQGLDFSWTDLTEELVNEGLIEKTDEEFYAGGGSVKEIKKKAEKLLEDSITYRFVSNNMGSGWSFELESPSNKNVFNVIEKHTYLDEFSPDDMGIEDYDELSEQEKDYYYEEWKETLLEGSFENFKQKCQKHLDEFIEYLQRDSDDNFAGGGKAGAESKSKIKIIENKKEGKKTATQTLVKENNKGEKITYELSVGMHTTPKENRYADGWFEIYATDENDDEYFYSEGGLWIESGRVYDYDGVYELSEKLRPLMSALNLNTQDIYEEGGSVDDYISQQEMEFSSDKSKMRNQYGKENIKDIEYQGFLAIDENDERLSDYEFEGEEFDRDNLLEVAKKYPQANNITFHARIMGESDFGIEDELSPIDDLAMEFDMARLN
jgi:hypothetical protein